MESNVIVETQKPAMDIGPRDPISHIGHVGDRAGLCGSPTLGIPAPGTNTCVMCDEVWSSMSEWARFRFRHRF